MIVFGGQNGATYHNDLHTFNPSTGAWAVQDVKSGTPPSPRANATAVLIKSKLFIYGGVWYSLCKKND